MSNEPLQAVSYGGGVQSTALLVLAASGELNCKTFLFANVGDDSEHPATLRYVREVAMPYAAAHGIEIVELHYTRKDGTPESLIDAILKPSSRADLIPVRLGSGAPAIRACTSQFKIKVIAHWLRRHGASKHNPAQVNMGISLDEFQRMRSSSISYETLIYPLIERRMSRQDCVNTILRAGLPVPPKSSCWFCPFHRMSQWQDMAEMEPDVFARAVALEAAINAKRARFGKDMVFFTDKLIPLNKAIGNEAQGKLNFETEPICDSGFCFM